MWGKKDLSMMFRAKICWKHPIQQIAIIYMSNNGRDSKQHGDILRMQKIHKKIRFDLSFLKWSTED